jgi:5-methyltetrahydrofolate--homocysteine methyltransferase
MSMVDNQTGGRPAASLPALLERERIGRERKYKKGQMLHWKDEPVDQIFVVKRGAIKVFTISAEGKAHTYNLLGTGGISGAAEYLLGRPHQALAMALEETEAFSILPNEFDGLLNGNPEFAAIITRELAKKVLSLAGKVYGLGFLDVQHRLKQSLIDLAEQHGVETDDGIKIELPLTHEQIGELVAANRSTVTSQLNELSRQGYLRKSKRNLIILPPKHIQILDNLSEAVVEGNESQVDQWARQVIAKGINPFKAFDALASGMRLVDRMLDRGELNVGDVALSAYAMKKGIAVLKEHHDPGVRINPGHLGSVVIGTVQGDIHDIGRTIVAMLLAARGFRVIDLGINVSTEGFLEAVHTHQPDILAMSALMDTSASEQGVVIRALKASGIKDKLNIIVGGGAVTQRFCDEIGANGYASDGHRAVELAWHMVCGM